MNLNYRYLVQKHHIVSADVEEWLILESSDMAYKIQLLNQKETVIFWKLKSDIEKDYKILEELGFCAVFPEEQMPHFPDSTGTPNPYLQYPTTSINVDSTIIDNVYNKSNGCKCGGNCACNKSNK